MGYQHPGIHMCWLWFWFCDLGMINISCQFCHKHPDWRCGCCNDALCCCWGSIAVGGLDYHMHMQAINTHLSTCTGLTWDYHLVINQGRQTTPLIDAAIVLGHKNNSTIYLVDDVILLSCHMVRCQFYTAIWTNRSSPLCLQVLYFSLSFQQFDKGLLLPSSLGHLLHFESLLYQYTSICEQRTYLRPSFDKIWLL